MQGFLKFSRPEDLKLQPIRVGALLDEIVPILQSRGRPRRRRARRRSRATTRPTSTAIPAMLRQAFLNLAQNACQAMPQGGTLRIHCASAKRTPRVRSRSPTPAVGIKPEHLQRIFDLYFTTKEKGSGIGLSMVFRTIQMHDGEIEVRVDARSRDDVPSRLAAGLNA